MSNNETPPKVLKLARVIRRGECRLKLKAKEEFRVGKMERPPPAIRWVFKF